MRLSCSFRFRTSLESSCTATAQVNKADAEDLLEPSEIAEVAIARLFQLMLNELPASAAHGHIPEAKASRIVGVSAARRATLSAVVRNDPSSYLTKTATFRSSILKGNITENIRNAAYRAKRQAGEEAETERTMKWPNWFQKGFGETLVDYMQRATTVTTTDEHGLCISSPLVGACTSCLRCAQRDCQAGL